MTDEATKPGQPPAPATSTAGQEPPKEAAAKNPAPKKAAEPKAAAPAAPPPAPEPEEAAAEPDDGMVEVHLNKAISTAIATGEKNAKGKPQTKKFRLDAGGPHRVPPSIAKILRDGGHLGQPPFVPEPGAIQSGEAQPAS